MSRRAGERFRILRFHREGGLGRIYVARDEELGREVALKEIRPEKLAEGDLRSRFVLEAEINGGLEAGKRFVDALELHSHVANIGDVRSLVIHPASTTHSQLTPDEQAATGVTPGLVRLSVGLEGIDDILADLEAGFRASKGA